jgi:hypothetical protein
MHVAFMDRGPTSDIIPVLYERYGDPSSPLEHTDLSPHDSDWDVLYPISSFMDTYRWSVQSESFEWPLIGMNVDVDDRTVYFKLNFVSLLSGFADERPV